MAEHDTAGHFVSSARGGHSTPLLVFRWSETPPPNPWKGAAHVEHGSPHLSQPISRKSLAELNPDAWAIPGSVSLAGNSSNHLMTIFFGLEVGMFHVASGPWLNLGSRAIVGSGSS